MSTATVPNYCANCGSTGACKKWRERDGHDCLAQTRPLTSAQQREADVLGMIAGMTSEQLVRAMSYLTGRNIETTSRAMQYAGVTI